MSKPVLSTPARWLVNIGLTLQFYIPLVVYAFFAGIMLIDQRSGLGFAFGCIFAFTFIAFSAILIAYLLWDRLGNPRYALWFLVLLNTIPGGLWLIAWIASQGSSLFRDPDVWLISPLPLLVPTALYLIALYLFQSTSDR